MSLVIQPGSDHFSGNFLNNGGGIPVGGTRHAGHSDWQIIETPRVYKKLGQPSIGGIDKRKYDGPTTTKRKINVQQIGYSDYNFLPTPKISITQHTDNFGTKTFPQEIDNYPTIVRGNPVVDKPDQPSQPSQLNQPTGLMGNTRGAGGSFMDGVLSMLQGYSPFSGDVLSDTSTAVNSSPKRGSKIPIPTRFLTSQPQSVVPSSSGLTPAEIATVAPTNIAENISSQLSGGLDLNNQYEIPSSRSKKYNPKTHRSLIIPGFESQKPLTVAKSDSLKSDVIEEMLNGLPPAPSSKLPFKDLKLEKRLLKLKNFDVDDLAISSAKPPPEIMQMTDEMAINAIINGASASDVFQYLTDDQRKRFLNTFYVARNTPPSNSLLLDIIPSNVTPNSSQGSSLTRPVVTEPPEEIISPTESAVSLNTFANQFSNNMDLDSDKNMASDTDSDKNMDLYKTSPSTESDESDVSLPNSPIPKKILAPNMSKIVDAFENPTNGAPEVVTDSMIEKTIRNIGKLKLNLSTRKSAVKNKLLKLADQAIIDLQNPNISESRKARIISQVRTAGKHYMEIRTNIKEANNPQSDSTVKTVTIRGEDDPNYTPRASRRE